MELLRLQKYFTDCGILSRRAAEAEISAGRVLVNGAVATVGMRIDPATDVVVWQGREIRPTNGGRHYLLLHKPRGFVTTLRDEKGRRTVADLVADTGLRLYPVGRLDMDSDGLLLMTDDGALANRLTHPRHEIPKHYRVTIRGAVSDAQLAALQQPFMMDGYQTLPVKVTVVERTQGSTVLTFVLYEGRNRQIRRMCEAVGLSIKQLTRTAIGKITLGTLSCGKHRNLTPEEISYLLGQENKEK